MNNTDSDDECWTYNGVLQQFVECKNTHPDSVIEHENAFECEKCLYIVVKPEESN